MPPKNTIKGNKCIICSCDIPKDRVENSVTCGRQCSKVYARIRSYIKSNIISKHIIENKKLKKELKVMENVG